MARLTVLVLLVIGALAPGPDASAQTVAQAVMIEPGRSIGPFAIGMALDQARAAMETFGAVEEVTNARSHGFCNPDNGVGVCVFDRWDRLALNTPGQVAYIVTDDARFATQPGSHKVGQPLLDFLKTFGLYSAGVGSEVRWDGRGLAVEVGPGEAGLTVRLIDVFAPRPVAAALPLPAR